MTVLIREIADARREFERLTEVRTLVRHDGILDSAFFQSPPVARLL